MPVKVNIGLSKKVGLPDYGSAGASCQVEFELDGGYDNGSSEHFQDSVRRAYLACRQAVEREISANHQSSQTVESKTNGSQGIAGRSATASQIRAIHAIAGRNRIDLKELLPARHGVHRAEDLGIKDASSLIDFLKSPTVQQ